MKRILSSTCSALAIAFFAIAMSPRITGAQVGAPVTVTTNEIGYVLDNGIIQALVSSKSGDLISMKYKGVEMLGTFMKEDGTPDLVRDPPGDPGRMGGGMADHMYGFWSHDAVGPRGTSSITIDPKTNGGTRAEVSVKAFSDGTKLGHGPGAAADGNFAADIDIRYSLGQAEQGLYTYCTFEHKPEYPDATMGEARFCVKLNSEVFDWMLASEKHNLMYPWELERDGDNKYNYTVVQWENPTYGWASFYKNTGFFFVNASVEYLTGPPTKVEFVCHRDTTGPMYAPTILNYWRSSHYGGGGVDVAKGEHWTKVIGPFLLYCNNGPSPQAIYADAMAMQRREAAKWPYDWVSGVDYPHKDQRATVKGQLVLTDPIMPSAAMSYVRVGLSAPDYKVPVDRTGDVNSPLNIHWQVDSKHYEFWVRGGNDGTFEIPNVRAGKYTMHAIADGVLGEFTKTDVTVESGKPLDLGKLTWTPVRRGKQLWEIGVPNRSGSEYLGGNDYFHDGMNLVYANLFPNDVSFSIGKSDFRKDWFYLHGTHASEAALAAAAASPPKPPPGTRGGFGGGGGGGGGAPRPAPWTITFNMPATPRGKATLRFGVATNNNANVLVSVNDAEAGRMSQMPTDSAIGRNGVQGIWFERELAFDASLMKPGANTITLTNSAGGIIYDYLRLELDESSQPGAAQ